MNASAVRSYQRSRAEKLFLLVFFPALTLFYVVVKYPRLLPAGADPRTFYLAGKSPAFWYAALYTAVVCGACIWVLATGRNRYQRSRKKGPISRYQRAKFTTILLVQFFVFFFFPYVVPALKQPGGFWNDPARPPTKASHVYLWPALLNWKLALYVFVLIPVVVWFLGKRYCSWFCACGNLAEAVGVTPWGAKWVRHRTPRGTTAKRFEVLQLVVLVFSVFFGLMLLADGLHVLQAPNLIQGLIRFQDFGVDFLFGSLVGLGAYPLLGTRIWCRYGCPLAKWMQLVGRVTGSRFRVVPNDKCRGLGLCTQACPMGIDVASYAHRDKQPLQIPFGLAETPCIGCGGCIDVCPVGALSFAPILPGGSSGKSDSVESGHCGPSSPA